MKLLDLFCGAGGAAMGYFQAGFDKIIGVDIKPQPRYPFQFIQADALDFAAKYGQEFDLVHASPPCQEYSITKNFHSNQHPDLISATRELLLKLGKPYVIENVPGAPLVNYSILCGTYFNLGVYRHRLFETPYFFLVPPHISHKDSIPRAGRGPSPKGYWSVSGKGGQVGTLKGWSTAMGINWMTVRELSQAVPPAYTMFLGKRIMSVISGESPAFSQALTKS